MSFIISVYVNGGIVLASDSRISYNETKTDGNSKTVLVGVHNSDTMDKTFICPNNIGISTCGDASIKGIPITGYIEDFIRTNITDQTDIDILPNLIILYFQGLDPNIRVHFLIAGYKDEGGKLIQKIYQVHTNNKMILPIDTSNQGAKWDGETTVFSKIVQPTAILNADGTYSNLPFFGIPFNLFTLQDAINFAKYAVDVTIQTMHFQNINETVGGPIDILVIKPDESFWITHKKLHI
ncbi:hypothetical protein [Sphaerochaeta sp. PS]|uniref:hypothetical protein n=1 Tax=Sphaerochaeta sp. PS TaxID=3076336 RepID=UPI0028A35164|nr:hypothetical protein [Sphaerochaeta sp. PS]MDT4761828.1 hypothetical protein [Sphaerochaeta sp. PS]